MFENDRDLKKLDPGFQCSFDRAKLNGTAEGQQFKAKMSVSGSGQQSSVHIEVELPFHLALVKGMVQKTLEKKLAAALA